MLNFSRYLYESVDTDINKALKLSHSDYEMLLKLDNQYGHVFIEWWNKFNQVDVDKDNYNTEKEKFFKARKEGKKYFPQIKLIKATLTEEWTDKAEQLISKFKKFDCFLSKYYIENLKLMILQAKIVYDMNDDNLKAYNKVFAPKPSAENYKLALTLLKRHPYKNQLENQKWTGPDVVDELRKHIKKCKFEWDVELDDHLVARMNVIPNRPELNIKTDAHFSDIDVASLKVHEVEVHCARRSYGLDKGLYLMLDGLAYRNTTDEGLAIFNSINYNPKGIKPNLFFDIAIKTVIGYNFLDMDFCELFDFLKPLCGNDKKVDEIIYRNLIRFKRTVRDTKLPGGNALCEEDYFCGYQLIKGMDKKLREDLIKYNIGPKQIPELDLIKRFFEVNKFPKLTAEDVKKISKKYK